MFLISIHAPAKGATKLLFIIHATYKYFNPRSREGSDGIAVSGSYFFLISIHAPAKGATLSYIQYISSCVFQSTLPRRERQINSSQYSFSFVFQSTLPRRERPFLPMIFVSCFVFQSTLPRRERQQYYTTNFIFFV